jgi:predicted XRE-type DNA-binding protein
MKSHHERIMNQRRLVELILQRVEQAQMKQKELPRKAGEIFSRIDRLQEKLQALKKRK